MGTGNTFKTDLYSLYDYVQNTLIIFPKEIFIETLRKFFSQDSYYHYQRDSYGFPLTPDHTDLEPGAGLNDEVTTRLFIGEQFRQEVIYYPALLIKHGGSRSVPISMSRDKDSVQWSTTKVIDGYGNEAIYSTPSHFIQAGAWEGSIVVDVKTRSLRSRDELTELVSLMFVDAKFDDLKNSGILIKNINVSGPSETEDRNAKLFLNSITFDIRSEWRRQIPIDTVIDAINFCVDFGRISGNTQTVATNLSIETTIELIDNLVNL